MFPKTTIEPLESRIAPAAMLALAENNSLLRFDTATPHLIQATVPITGLGDGETLVAMDFEPDSGFLYGLVVDTDSQGHIYRLNAGTGAASFVVTLQPKPLDDAPYSGLQGSHFSLDFALSSLSVGEVRIVSDAGHNLRLTDLASGIVETQPAPQYDSTDPNAGSPLVLSGATYYNTRPDGFFAIDVESDRLVYGYPKTRIDLGLYTTSRDLGVDASGPVGMDLLRGDQILFASLQVNGVTALYKISSSAATATTLVNTIGNGAASIRDIALVDTVWAGLGENNLWSTPENWASGLAPGPDSSIFIRSGSGVLESVNDFAPSIKFKSLNLQGQNIVSGSPLTVASGLFVTGSALINADLKIAQLPFNSPSPVISARSDSHLTFGGALNIQSNFVLISGSGTVNIPAAVSGDGRFQVSGPSAIFDGNGINNQQIDVFDGSLTLTGEHANRGIEVSGRGRLIGGSPVASIYSDLQGIIAPGSGEIGSVAVGGLILLHETTKFEFQLDGTGSQPENDSIVYAGNNPIFLRGELILTDSPDSQPGSRFIILQNEGTAFIEAGFAGIAEGQIITTAHHRYWFTYTGGDGNDIELVQLAEASISLDGRSATFTDVDGDLVQLTVSQGALSTAQFLLVPPTQGSAAELVSLNLTSFPDGTKITIKATPQDLDGDRQLEGDGYVNIGRINAAGVILGNVLVDGNLGNIKAGKAPEMLGVKSLTVHALGTFGAFAANLSDYYGSQIVGHLGKLNVTTDVSGAHLAVQGNIGPILVGGSLLGGSASDSGKIAATGNITSVKVGGSIQGDSGDQSGSLHAGGTVGSLTIVGSVRGSSGAESGSVVVGKLSKLSIGGKLVGGSGDRSGAIIVSTNLGSAKIIEAIEGRNGNESGSLLISGAVGRVSVGQSMERGLGANSGSLIAESRIQSLKVGGNLSGDVISRAGHLAQLNVAGSLFGHQGDRPLILASSIGSITVKGHATFADIASDSTISRVSIAAEATGLGIYATASPHPARTISSVHVGGIFADSRILAGYSFTDQMFVNPDASIGSVFIGGDFIRSDISAGIDPVDGQFGNSDDRVIGSGGNQALFSKIASVTIKGQAHGNGESDRHFGIIAESLGKVRIGRISLPLTSGVDQFILGDSYNLQVREERTTLLR